MPQLGVSVAEGTVVRWLVEPGDAVRADDPLCEVDTDKVVTDIPSPATGVLAEILVPVGTTVAVGTVLARIASGDGSGAGAPADGAGESSAATPAPPAEPAAQPDPPAAQPVPPVAPDAETAVASASPTAPAPSATTAIAPSAPAAGAGSAASWLSPVVSRLAAELGVDLSQVTGTGRGGRIRKQDVLAAAGRDGRLTPPPASAPAAAPARSTATGAPASPPSDRPLHIESPYRPDPAPADDSDQLSRMRRAIGEHMKRSLETAATCTTWMEADMSRVEQARRDAKASALLGVTPLPIVARATIDALAEHPALNATLEGERYTRHRAVHLGIAVSLGDDGLIVPVIRNAQELSVEELGVAIRDLSRRARRGQLTPDEVRGGTFTITNPGHFGSLMATPIINQPQVAILDLEAIVKRPIVVQDESGNDVIEIRPQTILGLSWDHRALDGAQAAQFLGALRRRLESWDG